MANRVVNKFIGCFIFAVCSSCMVNSLRRDLVDGFSFRSPLIEGQWFLGCKDRRINLDELLSTIRVDLKNDLKAREIDDTYDILVFEKASFYGVKKIKNIYYVSYWFSELRDISERIVGEGGVAVIVDVCSAKLFSLISGGDIDKERINVDQWGQVCREKI